ncbi:MAG: RNA-directed polymerase [Bacillota bacterium]|jgi:retron-type reverse transcriptase|nr:RNA-directed polymerase [Bacillota bacterium]
MITTLRDFLALIKPNYTYTLFRDTDEAYKINRSYRPVVLKKRNGGMRILQVPDQRLRHLQRKILNYLQHAEISPSAAAYVKGRSIPGHAMHHAGNKMLVKLDIADFFGSISFPKVLHAVTEALKRSPVFSDSCSSEISWFITKVCTLNGSLPQGAPTSPILSNMVFLPLDQIIESYCFRRGIHYTRYSDDMFFSGDFQPFHIIGFIRKLLKKNGYTLNEKKIVVAGSGNRQTVTGVVVNKRPQAERSYRREIRQCIYYIGKFGLEEHMLRKGLISMNEDLGAQMVTELQRLIGRIVFVLQIDPNNREFQEYKRICVGLLNGLPAILSAEKTCLFCGMKAEKPDTL